MTEHEKLLAGLEYDCRDPELWQLHLRGWKFNQDYNALFPGDLDTRRRLLEQTLAHWGRSARINQPFLVDYGCHISIGDNSLVNLGCTFLDTGLITIGKDVLIGPNVKIYTSAHPLYGPDRVVARSDGTAEIVTTASPVKIGDDSWIGGGTIILPGVTIGRNVIIGAGSVVTKNIPDDALACGNPAIIKKWNRKDGLVPLADGFC